MTNLVQEASTIASRLRMEMPVHITLPDPISGKEFTLYRENVLAALIVDTPNLLLDSQSVAAHYAEMARAQRACERAAASAEAAYRKWRSERADEFRKANKDRKFTKDEVEESYRIHADYEKVTSTSSYYEKLAGLFEDLKKAFDIKARIISAQVSFAGGDLRARRAEDQAEQAAPRTSRQPRT